MEVQWHNVAKAAYETYLASMNAHPSQPQIEAGWDTLSAAHQEAWIEAVRYATNLAVSAATA